MSVTEIISVIGVTLTVSGFIINNLVSLSKRIRELEKDLASEKARSVTEDRHHTDIINEIKNRIDEVNNKLDSIIKLVKS